MLRYVNAAIKDPLGRYLVISDAVASDNGLPIINSTLSIESWVDKDKLCMEALCEELALITPYTTFDKLRMTSSETVLDDTGAVTKHFTMLTYEIATGMDITVLKPNVPKFMYPADIKQQVKDGKLTLSHIGQKTLKLL